MGSGSARRLPTADRAPRQPWGPAAFSHGCAAPSQRAENSARPQSAHRVTTAARAERGQPLPRHVGEYLLDHALGAQWRQAKLASHQRWVCCPLHAGGAERHASLRISESTLQWYCDPCGTGGGPARLALLVLGEEKRRELLRELHRDEARALRAGRGVRREPAPPAPVEPPKAPAVVEDLGSPTKPQIAALIRGKRLRDPRTLAALGARHLRVTWPERRPDTWLGFPLLRPDCWRVWGISGSGYVRPDTKGRLGRLSVGPVSIIASPELRGEQRHPVARLWDVAGESDLLAAVEVALPHVIASTAGEGSLKAHNDHADWLRALAPAEVAVVRDLDATGERGAQLAAQWWRRAGFTVRIVPLPAELGLKGDLRDFLNGRAR